jgi:hypothetical protein
MFAVEAILAMIVVVSLAAGKMGAFWLCFLISLALTPMEAWFGWWYVRLRSGLG